MSQEKHQEQEEYKMSFTEHLEELRNRLIKIFIAVAVGFVVSYFFSKQLFYFLSLPLLEVLPKQNSLIFTALPEAFFTYLKISLFAGIFLVSPYIFYQMWKFISPGLYSEEKKYVFPFVVVSTLFFLTGASFGYFVVFPFGFKFFIGFQSEYIKALPSLKQYLGFAMKLLFAFGTIFEMPVIMYFLAKIKVINSQLLTKNRKYTVVLIFVVAALLTPPDVFTQVLMALPLIILYELSIWIVKYVEKQRSKKDGL
jgi:sec-independent protein translocase protein TatC